MINLHIIIHIYDCFKIIQICRILCMSSTSAVWCAWDAFDEKMLQNFFDCLNFFRKKGCKKVTQGSTIWLISFLLWEWAGEQRHPFSSFTISSWAFLKLIFECVIVDLTGIFMSRVDKLISCLAVWMIVFASNCILKNIEETLAGYRKTIHLASSVNKAKKIILSRQTSQVEAQADL